MDSNDNLIRRERGPRKGPLRSQPKTTVEIQMTQHDGQHSPNYIRVDKLDAENKPLLQPAIMIHLNGYFWRGTEQELHHALKGARDPAAEK